MTRLRALAVAAALVALVPLLATAPPATAAGDGFSRWRITLSTTSDWARVALRGIDVRVHRTVSLTRGAKHYAKDSGWTIVPLTPDGATTVVDAVVQVPDGAEPVVVLRKGMVGAADLRIEATNGDPARVVVDRRLETNDRHRNELQVPLDPEAVGIGELAVGPVDPRRLTLAFYYPWFSVDTPSRWSAGPDEPVAPYATDRADEVAGMVSEARSAGVDGFVVSWSGDRHRGSVELLMTAVAAPGFTVSPVLELPAFRSRSLLIGSAFDAGAAARAARAFFDLAEGAALEVDGRRVMFVFGLWELSPAEWRSLRAQIADLDLFVVGDRLARSHPVDGSYSYDPNGHGKASLERRARVAVDESRLRPLVDPSVERRLWAATVSPGLDTRHSRPLWEARRTPRDGGARYDLTWDVALRAHPDWVLVTSWNEWYEQTHIAPGTRTGRRALEQTTRWTSRF